MRFRGRRMGDGLTDWGGDGEDRRKGTGERRGDTLISLVIIARRALLVLTLKRSAVQLQCMGGRVLRS